ncbi:MAG: acyltransferase family protein [Parahaliea sp.]
MRHDPKLDGLRAIAAVVVVAFHSWVPGFGSGFLGVDVFFVLSGYLITKLLIEERLNMGKISYNNFFVRRFWRLYPAFLLLLFIYAVVGPVLYPEYELAKHYKDILISGFYLSDYAVAYNALPSVLNHTWSLAVEVHFYLLWPFILNLILRMPRKNLFFVLFIMWVLATLWRLYAFFLLKHGWTEIYHGFGTHCSGLIFGALIATLKPIKKPFFSNIGFLILLIAAVLFKWKEAETVFFAFTFSEVGSALLILSPPAWLGNKVLVFTGKISYGLYLWHYPIVRVMRNFEASWEGTFFVSLVFGAFLAITSYYMLEKPLLKYRENKQ